MQYAIELGTRRCVRAHRPLQQGLRRRKFNFYKASVVRDHRPLQQGLRQLFIITTVQSSLICTRPSSTTTRIKT